MTTKSNRSVPPAVALYRTVTGLGLDGPEALLAAAAAVRERLWAGRDRSGPLVVDVDSTLVEAHFENKAGAAPHYQGGYGFHPMVCSAADGMCAHRSAVRSPTNIKISVKLRRADRTALEWRRRAQQTATAV